MNRLKKPLKEDEKISIGKGTKMSIAKASLIVYFKNNHTGSFNLGLLDEMGDIVDIAGAKQCSWLTPPMVMNRLRNSPYWDCQGIKGYYLGCGWNGKTTIAYPSKKGIEYYKKVLKPKIKND